MFVTVYILPDYSKYHLILFQARAITTNDQCMFQKAVDVGAKAECANYCTYFYAGIRR